jgi:ATP synthase protein I
MSGTARPRRGGIFRSAVVPTAAAGALLVAGSALVAGGRGALGAAAGCLLVIVFFGLDFIGLRWVGRFPDAPIQLAILAYAAKVTGLGTLLVVFGDSPAIGRGPFAVAVFAGTAVWLIGHLRVFSRLIAAPSASAADAAAVSAGSAAGAGSTEPEAPR